jgi:hypothetical protein
MRVRSHPVGVIRATFVAVSMSAYESTHNLVVDGMIDPRLLD